jgi:hypothetical protein
MAPDPTHEGTQVLDGFERDVEDLKFHGAFSFQPRRRGSQPRPAAPKARTGGVSRAEGLAPASLDTEQGLTLSDEGIVVTDAPAALQA